MNNYDHPEELIFLDIDTQRDFFEPEGRFFLSNSEKIRANLGELAQLAVLKKVPYIATLDSHQANDPEFAKSGPHCVIGSQGQKKIHETTLDDMILVPHHQQYALDKFPDFPIVLTKQTRNLFDNVNAETAFGKTGRKKVVIFGISVGESMVLVSKVLIEKGYEVYVVTDAIAAMDSLAGEKMLGDLEIMGAVPTFTSELVEIFKTCRE